MIKRLLLFVSFICILSANCAAQAALGIGRNGITGIPDSSTFGAVMKIEFYALNKGDQAYTGPVYANWETAKTNRQKVDTAFVTNLNPGDSVKLDFRMETSKVAFNNGTNIIVIWPTGTSIPTKDSLKQVIFITETSGINESQNELVRVSVFPNPTTNIIQVSSLQNERLKQVEIFDTKGKKILVVNKDFNNIDVTALSSGLYFINVNLMNGCSGRYKLLISE